MLCVAQQNGVPPSLLILMSWNEGVCHLVCGCIAWRSVTFLAATVDALCSFMLNVSNESQGVLCG